MTALLATIRSVADGATRPQFSTEVRWITPAMAEKWLASVNIGNRSESEAEIRLWVDRFNLGRYQPTHQGIAFDESGFLLDGQTRLRALTLAKVPGAWFMVTTNVPRSAFAVMDVGRNRQAAHLIPGPHATTKAAAARLMVDFPRITISTRKIDPAELVEVYAAHADSIDLAAEYAKEVHRGCAIQPAGHAAVLATVISSGDAAVIDRIPEWAEGLSTGSSLSATDPRLALRNRWAVDQNRLNGGGRMARAESAFLLIRAWNGYIKGEAMTKLQLPRGGRVDNASMPEVVR